MPVSPGILVTSISVLKQTFETDAPGSTGPGSGSGGQLDIDFRRRRTFKYLPWTAKSDGWTCRMWILASLLGLTCVHSFCAALPETPRGTGTIPKTRDAAAADRTQLDWRPSDFQGKFCKLVQRAKPKILCFYEGWFEDRMMCGHKSVPKSVVLSRFLESDSHTTCIEVQFIV